MPVSAKVDPGNIELAVKILDACPSYGYYWPFLSRSTNLGVTMTVVDTKNQLTHQYVNPDRTLLQPMTDFCSFACP